MYSVSCYFFQLPMWTGIAFSPICRLLYSIALLNRKLFFGDLIQAPPSPRLRIIVLKSLGWQNLKSFRTWFFVMKVYKDTTFWMLLGLYTIQYTVVQFLCNAWCYIVYTFPHGALRLRHYTQILQKLILHLENL